MNTFVNHLNNLSSMKNTENGAVAYNTTNNSVYDLFALGGAYRTRSTAEKNTLFTNAFNENPELALKCLFYLRDVRGGQGERDFFRVNFDHIILNDMLSDKTIEYLFNLIPEYGRWDDLLYFYGRHNAVIDKMIVRIIKKQLSEDFIADHPSLLAKWLPSENASSRDAKFKAIHLAKEIGMTPKRYRKTLSYLRNQIKVVEKLMSENRWNEIEFDKLPSKAGYLYRNAFANREETRERYDEFIHSDNTTVNSSTLYPYEIVKPCYDKYGYNVNYLPDSEIQTMQKYWDNLPNYLTGKNHSVMCMVDVSGSMSGLPLMVSTSLGVYCAERLNGAFNNLFMTFSENPQVVKLRGHSIYEKIKNMNNAGWGFNTDLVRAMRLILKIAKQSNSEDVPDALLVISDMEIDMSDRDDTLMSDMENVRSEFENAGIKMPHMIYWNVNARHDTVLDRGNDVTCVSGFSPVIFQMVLSGKTGMEVMLDKLNSERYSSIKIIK